MQVFPGKDISVIAPDKTGEYAQYVRALTETHRVESEISAGAALGGLGGLLIGMAALAIPVLAC